MSATVTDPIAYVCDALDSRNNDVPRLAVRELVRAGLVHERLIAVVERELEPVPMGSIYGTGEDHAERT